MSQPLVSGRGFINVALVAISVLFFVAPVSAQHFVNGRSVVVSDSNVPFREMMAMHGVGPRRLEKQANLSSEVSDSIFVFPVVGNAPGSRGTYFRSETTIVNNVNRPQDVLLFYFPQNGGPGNCNLPGKKIRLDSFQWVVWSDFVGTVFGQTGLGSVIVFGVNGANNLDTSSSLDGMSRIYTPQPGTNGQVSQSFPGVVINTSTGTRLYGYGLRQDADFRTNIGILNYDAIRQLRRTFDVIINGIDGSSHFTVDVDPCNLAFFAAPVGTYGIFELSAFATDGGALWYGFGSSNDNNTGDNWSAILH